MSGPYISCLSGVRGNARHHSLSYTNLLDCIYVTWLTGVCGNYGRGSSSYTPLWGWSSSVSGTGVPIISSTMSIANLILNTIPTYSRGIGAGFVSNTWDYHIIPDELLPIPTPRGCGADTDSCMDNHCCVFPSHNTTRISTLSGRKWPVFKVRIRRLIFSHLSGSGTLNTWHYLLLNSFLMSMMISSGIIGWCLTYFIGLEFTPTDALTSIVIS